MSDYRNEHIRNYFFLELMCAIGISMTTYSVLTMRQSYLIVTTRNWQPHLYGLVVAAHEFGSLVFVAGHAALHAHIQSMDKFSKFWVMLSQICWCGSWILIIIILTVVYGRYDRTDTRNDWMLLFWSRFLLGMGVGNIHAVNFMYAYTRIPTAKHIHSDKTHWSINILWTHDFNHHTMRMLIGIFVGFVFFGVSKTIYPEIQNPSELIFDYFTANAWFGGLLSFGLLIYTFLEYFDPSITISAQTSPKRARESTASQLARRYQQPNGLDSRNEISPLILVPPQESNLQHHHLVSEWESYGAVGEFNDSSNPRHTTIADSVALEIVEIDGDNGINRAFMSPNHILIVLQTIEATVTFVQWGILWNIYAFAISFEIVNSLFTSWKVLIGYLIGHFFADVVTVTRCAKWLTRYRVLCVNYPQYFSIITGIFLILVSVILLAIGYAWHSETHVAESWLFFVSTIALGLGSSLYDFTADQLYLQVLHVLLPSINELHPRQRYMSCIWHRHSKAIVMEISRGLAGLISGSLILIAGRPDDSICTLPWLPTASYLSPNIPHCTVRYGNVWFYICVVLMILANAGMWMTLPCILQHCTDCHVGRESLCLSPQKCAPKDLNDVIALQDIGFTISLDIID